MSHHGRIAGVVVVGGCMLATAACGGSTSPLGLVQKAYASTVSAKTSKVSINETMQGIAGVTITVNGDGVIDFANHKADVTFGSPALQGGNVRFIGIGQDAWVSLPPAARAQLPGAKPFVHQTVSQPSSSNALDQLTSPDDPASTLAQLQGVSTNGVRKIGNEQVRGVSTKHLAATIDLNKVAAKDPASANKIQTLTKLLDVTTVPADIWVDGQGRVRRYRMSLQNLHLPTRQGAAAGNGSAPPSGTPNASIVITEEFYDFGAAVNVSAPPADQVSEASALKGSSGTK